MRYDIIVDHVARVCVWQTRRHYAIANDELHISDALWTRIEAWIDHHIELRDRPPDDPKTCEGWLDYDEEGWKIAHLLKSALGADAEVYYFSEAREEFELFP